MKIKRLTYQVPKIHIIAIRRDVAGYCYNNGSMASDTGYPVNQYGYVCYDGSSAQQDCNTGDSKGSQVCICNTLGSSDAHARCALGNYTGEEWTVCKTGSQPEGDNCNTGNDPPGSG